MTDFLHNHYVVSAAKGALSGFVTAAAVDYSAFRSWKSFKDAYSYDWPIAAWRWLQGIVVGALTGLGIGFTS